MKLRVLLLQAREPDDPIRRHEVECFVARTGLAEDRIAAHDLCGGPPSLGDVRRFDALMIGGSGAFYVTRGNLPRFDALLELLREVVEAGHPTFSSCFGYGCLVSALGGRMIHDPPRAEVGTYDVRLSEAGRRDALFGGLPDSFRAQMGHKDRADRMGDGIPNLASSERSPFQALRIPGKPIWATQFHPELDREANLHRFRRYLRDYGPGDPAELAAATDRFRDSPEAGSLLRRFLQTVFPSGG